MNKGEIAIQGRDSGNNLNCSPQETKTTKNQQGLL